MQDRRIDCVGAIVRDDRGRLLLIRRANEPGRGLWSIPGGRVEPGESDAEATVREVEEETGLHVVVGGLAGIVERDAGPGRVFLIRDYLCRPAPGRPSRGLRAGSDALEAAWVPTSAVPTLDCVDGLVEALREWHVLPQEG